MTLPPPRPAPYLKAWIPIVYDKEKTFKFSRTRTLKTNEKTVRVRGVSELSWSIEKVNLPCQKLVVTDFSALQCMVQCKCTYFIRNVNMMRHFYDKTWSVHFSSLFLPLYVTVPFFPLDHRPSLAWIEDEISDISPLSLGARGFFFKTDLWSEGTATSVHVPL